MTLLEIQAEIMLGKEMDGNVYASSFLTSISGDCYVIRRDYYRVLDGYAFIIEGEDGLTLTPSGTRLSEIYYRCKLVEPYIKGTPYFTKTKELSFSDIENIMK